MKIRVTGAAGFIGSHTARTLLAHGDDVVGLDNINTYYDPHLKEARLSELHNAAAQQPSAGYRFVRADLGDQASVEQCFAEHSFDRVIHLAAQAGIRHSIDEPREYVHSNLIGFVNILEACRHAAVPHLTYASTSSVYGANTSLPYSEHHGVDHPLQFYAATKRANELMAHSYSHLFRLPTTGLRFFTVYGPWGRPDMALFKCTQSILKGEPITLYNNGKHTRDFTFIDDIVEGELRASDQIAAPSPAWDAAAPDPATSNAPYRIFSIGNNAPVNLLDYVRAIEAATRLDAKLEMLPLQPGDAVDTFADVSELISAVDYRPATSVTDGVAAFVAWFRAHYAV